jgi:hypothetical protein
MDIERHLKDYWDRMVERVIRIGSMWRRFHLSLKGRVLIANTQMMSIPRYALRFLCRGQAEIRRRHSLYRTAAWCIWKAYITYSFAQSCMLWVPGAAAGSYREVIRKRILTVRTLCLSERYQSRQHNERTFQKVWGQPPREIRILKGPACLNWRTGVPGEAGANEGPSGEAAGQANGSDVESTQEGSELLAAEEP